MNHGVVDLTVPFYEGMPADDLGPKFWVRLSHAASRQLYQYTQNREGAYSCPQTTSAPTLTVPSASTPRAPRPSRYHSIMSSVRRT